MTQRHRVVILGGGFAGLNAAQRLARAPVDITLIDRRNFHLFQPLLYQVATGSLSPGEICAPLRGVLSKQKNTLVLMGEAIDVDPDAKRVQLKDGAGIDYDSLIVATGSKTSYYGNDAWREYAPSLKSIEEATAIRHKILYAFERAERCAAETDVHDWLTFVIVGAGATGLELAGALAEIANETLKNDFRRINPKHARIILMEGGDRVLPAYPPDLSEKAERLVKRLGVEVRTVLWTGGVIANTFGNKLAERTKAETDRSGRIKVQPDLTVPNYPDIFVVGDLAAASAKNGKPLPGVAQVAIQEGTYAAHTIRARLEGKKDPPPFHYLDKGDMAVIGRAAAVANIFGLHFWGLPAWLIWLFIHLLYIVEFQDRVLVFIQWGFEYFTFNRGARLITGAGDGDYQGPPRDTTTC